MRPTAPWERVGPVYFVFEANRVSSLIVFVEQLLRGVSQGPFFPSPKCVAKGSRLTLGGVGVELCSRPVASMFATVGNRPQ